ncbi:MAG: hypothetical protein WCV88_02065 [Patescibacteria group bacterium]|jgi:hypothetical protein
MKRKTTKKKTTPKKKIAPTAKKTRARVSRKKKSAVSPLDIYQVSPHVPAEPPASAPKHQTHHKHKVKTWSMRHNLINIYSIVFVGALALIVVAGYAQATFLEMSALAKDNSGLFMLNTIEKRQVLTSAGEMTLALPISWTLTDQATNSVRYTHTGIDATTMTITVTKNDLADFSTWLEQAAPTYDGTIAVSSPTAVAARNGATQHAYDANHNPIIVHYFPVTTAQSEQYVVTILGQYAPTGSSVIFDKTVSNLLKDFTLE